MESKMTYIDLTYLNSVTEGNQIFAKKLLASAVKDIEEKMASLIDGWRQKDGGNVWQAAHSLVFLSAIAGMPSVSNWCKTVDESLKEQSFRDEVTPYLKKIVDGWSEALPELTRAIEE